MKKLLTPLLLIITVMFGSVSPVAAEEALTAPQPDHPVIAALQTGQTGAAGNDFVEIYNPTNTAIDVTGWKLQYRAAASTGSATWTTKKTVACVTQPNDGSACQVMLLSKSSLVFATYAIDNDNLQIFSSGFSDVGGQVRLVASDASVQDTVGYGTASEAEGGMAALAPPLGQSLLRKVAAEQIVDTNNNGDDFVVGCYLPAVPGEIAPIQPPVAIACPQASANEDTAPTPPVDPVDPVTSVTPADPDPLTGATAAYARLTITELLPDPASPLTDSSDEFIELYNPTTGTVSAEGYMLETGSDFRYHFTVGADVTIAPGGYTAIISAESHLSLTNTGTAVRLLDPSGVVIDEVASYGQAKSGQAWAKVGGGWQWTSSPTPGSANAATAPATPAAAGATKKATAAAKSTAKTASAKAPKATTASKTAAKVAASNSPSVSADPQSDTGYQSYLLLIPVALAAVGYVVYEYRKDIARWYRKTWHAVTGKKDIKEPEPTPQMD
jgi:hypothetical protein